MRAGHGGSVTRILGQLGDALTGSDTCTCKLNQLKLSLKEQLDTLAKLDEEILCETDKEHVKLR